MPEKIIHVENIGSVKIRKSKRSKNVSIAIKPNKGVIVTIPYFLSYKYGIKVLKQKSAWIEKHLPKIKALEQKIILFDETNSFKTKKRQLIIRKHTSDNIRTKINENTIFIYYPENIPIETTEIQETIRITIIKALRIEAKEYLPERTYDLAKELGFKLKKVFIKNNKTLWGSCSGINNINLNLHLIRLPNHLIDYVIIHELCHTVEKNHGPQFWKLMDSILGNAKKISKELKQFSIQFY